MADVSQIKLPNGSVYDLIDEKSGYITAEYIENKTDYEIPVSRVGEIVVGETAIGTDSTNFPTSKAVVDYVDERVVQEMDAIDVGVTGIKANGTSLAIENGVVNIPAIGPNQSVGLMTDQWMQQIWNRLNSIPTSTSQLTNDSGFITSDRKVEQREIRSENSKRAILLSYDNNSGNSTTGPVYKNSSLSYNVSAGMLYVPKIELGTWSNPGTLALGGFHIVASSTTKEYTATLPAATGTIALTSDIPTKTSDLTNDSGFVTTDSDEKLKTYTSTLSNTVYYPVLGSLSTTASVKTVTSNLSYISDLNAVLQIGKSGVGTGGQTGSIRFYRQDDTRYIEIQPVSDVATENHIISLPNASGIVALTSDIPTVPTNISAFTNDSGYLTASDIASVMTYKGTKANYAALPASGNTTGDVWHLTDTGAEWAWDGSAWQELGTAIDLSGYLAKGDIADWAKASTKPTYTAAEVGALPDTTTIPSKTSDLTNDSGFITSYTDEKVKQNEVDVNDKYSYPLLFSDNYSYGNKITGTYKTSSLTFNPKSSLLTTSNIQIGGLLAPGSIKLGYLKISAVADTSANTINFPNASGTIALTSDITDEKLSVTNNSTVGSYYPILDTGASGAASTKTSDGFLKFSRSSNTQGVLSIGENGSAIGQLRLFTTSSGEYVTITPGTLTSARTITLPDKTGTIALTSDIPDTSSFLTSETDPVFTASAAAGITSTDISNWNAKVSDDKTWNGVTLNKAYMNNKSSTIVPIFESGAAYYYIATATPSGGKVVLYDNNAYLNSTTPSANDNSTKVATTAYVDSAVGGITVPTKTSELTNDSGFITSYTDEKVKLTSKASSGSYPLIFGPTSITSGSTYSMNYNSNIVAVPSQGRLDIKRILIHWTSWDDAYVKLDMSSTAGNAPDYYLPTLKFESGAVNTSGGTDKLVRIRGIQTPTDLSINNMMDYVATVKYVNDSIPKVYSSTNTGGYLTMATLPIYDGTVE